MSLVALAWPTDRYRNSGPEAGWVSVGVGPWIDASAFHINFHTVRDRTSRLPPLLRLPRSRSLQHLKWSRAKRYKSR